MQTRRIGSLDVSVIGLGCNNFGRRMDATQTETVVHASLDAGINFFDTADVYGSGMSEEYLGHALQQRRNEAIIATKFGNALEGQGSGAHPAYVRKAAEASLRRLKVDVIDLYQLHKPDPTVPIADTLGALDDLVKAGKVREIGCSNFSAEQLREAEAGAAGKTPFMSVQNYYSLFHRDPEAGVLAECERLGQGFLPYFPLENGLLTGKYRRGQPMPEGTRLTARPEYVTDEKLDKVEALIAYAESRGHTLLELTFGWLLARPVIASVIAGAMKIEQIQANAAATNWQMTDADMAAIDKLVQ